MSINCRQTSRKKWSRKTSIIKIKIKNLESYLHQVQVFLWVKRKMKEKKLYNKLEAKFREQIITQYKIFNQSHF